MEMSNLKDFRIFPTSCTDFIIRLKFGVTLTIQNFSGLYGYIGLVLWVATGVKIFNKEIGVHTIES